MLFIYIILVILCCWCAFWKLWCGKDSASLQPPVLSGNLPIIGHTHLIIRKDLHKLMTTTLKELLDNGITTSYLAWKKVYVITDPEAIMTISNTSLEKEDIIYKFLKPFLGEGLPTVGNISTWKTHRKFLNQAFSQAKFKFFIDVFNRQARCLIEQLDLRLGKPLNHENVLKLNNLETICMTATGIADDGCILREKYLPLVRKGLQIFKDRLHRPWLYSDFIFNLSSMKREQDKTSKQFWNLSNLIIENKRKEINSIRRYEYHETEINKSFLELILDATNETKSSYTDEQIIAEINTLIITGHETTALHLNVMLIVLGSHRDVQEKVYNEIFNLDKGLDRDLNSDNLTKLVYTEAFIKETLRVYAPVPVVARRIEKNIQINNYTLTANSTCILHLYALNRHLVWGPDADQFKPERWLDTATLPDMKHFGSFALGRRNCIAKTYAMLSMKVALVHLIRRYKVSADISKVEFKWGLTSYPASGNQYTLERRNKKE